MTVRDASLTTESMIKNWGLKYLNMRSVISTNNNAQNWFQSQFFREKSPPGVRRQRWLRASQASAHIYTARILDLFQGCELLLQLIVSALGQTLSLFVAFAKLQCLSRGCERRIVFADWALSDIRGGTMMSTRLKMALCIGVCAMRRCSNPSSLLSERKTRVKGTRLWICDWLEFIL